MDSGKDALKKALANVYLILIALTVFGFLIYMVLDLVGSFKNFLIVLFVLFLMGMVPVCIKISEKN